MTVTDALVTFGWGGLFLLAVLKQEWFFTFDNRFPRFEVFDRLIYTDGQKFAFIVARTFVLIIIYYVVGSMLKLAFN